MADGPGGQGMRNVELKAEDPDPEGSLAICRDLGAVDEGMLEQRDTYFRVGSGRLKLREHVGGPAQLIAYERPDVGAARESDYRIVEVSQPEEMRLLLEGALGAIGVVDKRRRLFLWHGVRIHLDEVTGLGRFIELEGVIADGRTESDMSDRVDTLRERLHITSGALIAGSYIDLLVS